MARTIKAKGAVPALPSFLQNSGKFAAFICTAKGKIVTQNSFLQNIFGLQDNKTVGIKDVFGIYNARLFSQSFTHLLNKKQAALDTEINRRKLSWELSFFDDEMTFILCVASVLQMNDNATGMGIEESHFSSFMNNSPALMWATNTSGRLVIVNKKFKEVTGFSDCVLGKTLWEVFPKEFADQYKQNDEKVLHLNDLVEMEETSLDKFGRKREFVVYKFPLQTADYGLVVAGWSVDITDHKIAHKKLVHQHNRFRQIARLQSHTVRRPLANILGLIDLIQYYSANGDFSEVSTMVDLLKESSNDLDSIIKKIVRKAGIFNPELQVSL